MSLLNNLRKRGLTDILNPKKWGIFARYLKMKALRLEYEELSIPEYAEQIVQRMSHPGCRNCIIEGECTHCGCKSPELFFDKSNECSGANWFTMQSPESWRESGVEVDPEQVKYLQKHGTIK